MNWIPQLPIEAWGAIVTVIGYAWRSLSFKTRREVDLNTIRTYQTHSAIADIVIVAGVIMFIYGVVA